MFTNVVRFVKRAWSLAMGMCRLFSAYHAYRLLRDHYDDFL